MNILNITAALTNYQKTGKIIHKLSGSTLLTIYGFYKVTICWTVGLLDCWTVGLLDCWKFRQLLH